MTDGSPIMSVVLPNYADSHCLRLTLRALTRQTLSPDRYEIIVAHDGDPGDAYDEVASTYSADPRVRFDDHPERTGRAAARNRGLRLARGRIVLMLDSDCFAAHDLLERHLEHHVRAAGPRVLSGSRFDLDFAAYRSLRADPDQDVARLAGGGRDIRFVGDFVPERMPQYMQTPWLFTYTSNASVPRSLLEESGMFDEDFGLGWGFEDTDLFYRLDRDHGSRGLGFDYSDAALCVHLPRFRAIRRERQDIADNGSLIRAKFRTFELELGVYPPVEVSDRIHRYRRLMALCAASGLCHIEDWPELTRDRGAGAGGRTLWIGYGSEPLARAGDATADYGRPLTSSNTHLLGLRTPYADREFDAVVSVDFWRFLPWNDLCRLLDESARISRRLLLTYSSAFAERVRSLDADVPVVDDLDCLLQMLAAHCRIQIHQHSAGAVVEVAS